MLRFDMSWLLFRISVLRLMVKLFRHFHDGLVADCNRLTKEAQEMLDGTSHK